MIKGIAFDKDGTLLEYESFWVKVAELAVGELLERRGCDAAYSDRMLRAIGAHDGIQGLLCHGTYQGIAAALDECLRALCPDAQPISSKEAAEAFLHNTAFGDVTPTCPDISGLFSLLRERGIKVVLITNDNMQLAEKCLESLGILSLFDKIYASDDVHPSKPNPYYMNRFREEFSLAAHEVMMVGDTVTDMRFAKDSGVFALGVAKTEKDRELLLPIADTVIHDISGIPELLEGHI